MSLMEKQVDVVVVGSGFSGLAMAAALKRSGRSDFVVLERAGDVGGTWRDNSYPGCACDVPSHVYSLSFAPNPDWSSTFSPQQEIWDYLRRTAEREGLTEHIRFDTALEEAAWDDDARRWRLRTSRGGLAARALVVATGPLTEPAIPDIPGLDRFPGTVFHSARWDHGHDVAGERVAVIGTGASAIQFVPQIQPQVGRLHLFQRTPPWIMPRPDRSITRAERALYRRVPSAQKLMRAGIYWAREAFAIPMLRVRLSPIIRVLAQAHLRRQVADADLRRKLTPSYAPGCKRILVSNDYLPSLSKSNVEVVTDGIREIRGRDIIAADGSARAVDTIILGTGFHVTDAPVAEIVRGRDGRTLAQHWEQGMEAHRGTTVAGFPNFFFLLGPNTGLGHNSVTIMAEAQARYIVGALDVIDRGGFETVEVRSQAQRAWNDAVQRRMRGTVWLSGGCASWYLDRNGRNTTLWPDFSFRFAHALRRFQAAEHVLTTPRHVREPEPLKFAA